MKLRGSGRGRVITPLLLGAKSCQHFAGIVYVLIVRGSVDQYIVNVYFTDANDIARQHIVSRAALKNGARALESHGYPRLLK